MPPESQFGEEYPSFLRNASKTLAAVPKTNRLRIAIESIFQKGKDSFR